jgi:hypothetical protein
MPLLSMNSRALPAFLVLPTPFSSAFSAAHMHPALVTQDSPSDHAVFHFSACLPFLVKTREPMLLHPSCQRVRHRRFGDGRKRTALIFHLHYGFFCCSHASSACHARLAVRSCCFSFYLFVRVCLLARREPIPLRLSSA